MLLRLFNLKGNAKIKRGLVEGVSDDEGEGEGEGVREGWRCWESMWCQWLSVRGETCEALLRNQRFLCLAVLLDVTIV